MTMKKIALGFIFSLVFISTVSLSSIHLLDVESLVKISLIASAEEEPQENEPFELTKFHQKESILKINNASRLIAIIEDKSSNYHDVLQDVIIPPPDCC